VRGRFLFCGLHPGFLSPDEGAAAVELVFEAADSRSGLRGGGMSGEDLDLTKLIVWESTLAVRHAGPADRAGSNDDAGPAGRRTREEETP
jgi:hypothetical protein